jgi:hypothetical protein
VTERATVTPSVGLIGILVRSFASAFAFAVLIVGRYTAKGTELTPRKLAIVFSTVMAAALIASLWQWQGKKPWSWVRTLFTVMILVYVVLRLGITVLSQLP